jgi:arylsulfatase A
MKTNHMVVGLVLIVALPWGKATISAAPVDRKPNIILIMADDLGYECVGANGGESYKTPVLDKMAKSGIRFNHCYSQPLCTPSRVQIMTGLYNVRNYVSFGTLEKSQTTFAHQLKKAGYTTCIAGKWQLGGEGPTMSELARHFGFDQSYLPSWYAYYWNPTIVVNGKVTDYRKEDYGPDKLNDLVCGFIEQNRDKPFFLYYPISLPHDPFLPTPDSGVAEPWLFGDNPEKQGPKGTPDMFKKGDPKYYGDMVAYMDKVIGRLLQKLDELGLQENTLVIFTGDNGSPVGQARCNSRLIKAGKGRMDDSGTHVPLIARWPAVIRNPSVCDDLVNFTDFFPTFCEMGGAEIPEAVKADGRSFLPQLRGEPGTRQWAYCWYTKYPTLSVPQEWARNQRYKLYRTGEFFNVSADREEKHPLTALTDEAKAVRTMLQRALDRYRDARPPEWAKNEKKARE